MVSKPQERSVGNTGSVMLLLGAILLPLLYFLSSGPMLWLTVTTGLPTTVWNVLYWPLTWSRDVIPGFHEFFQWYLGLWTW